MVSFSLQHVGIILFRLLGLTITSLTVHDIECLCLPPKFMCWNQNVQCGSTEKWGFWGMIRSWGQCLGDGVSALIKETLQISSFLPCEDRMKSLELRKEPSPNHAGNVISELGEINFCCSWATQSVLCCYNLNELRQ